VSSVKIGVKRLHPDAKLPKYAHNGDACADVYCLHGAIIPPGYAQEFKTGLAFEIPEGWMIEVRPRSGLSCRSRLIIPNSPGTIDHEYTGEFLVHLHNIGQVIQEIPEGSRICQIRPVPVDTFDFYETEELSETTRGTGGFGSTGK
jgi:dUTP pyrophosphatase